MVKVLLDILSRTEPENKARYILWCLSNIATENFLCNDILLECMDEVFLKLHHQSLAVVTECCYFIWSACEERPVQFVRGTFTICRIKACCQFCEGLAKRLEKKHHQLAGIVISCSERLLGALAGKMANADRMVKQWKLRDTFQALKEFRKSDQG